MDIWFISDTHFGHSNILSFKDKEGNCFRGDRFSTVEEMDEFMIQQWNSVVKPIDRVYHLGDVGICNKEKLLGILKRLNGSKRLILGNHDDGKWLVKTNMFKKVSLCRDFREYGFICSHIPLHESSLIRKGKLVLNVHGHTHTNGSPSGNYTSVCVEMVNYTPVHLDTLIQGAKL